MQIIAEHSTIFFSCRRRFGDGTGCSRGSVSSFGLDGAADRAGLGRSQRLMVERNQRWQVARSWRCRHGDSAAACRPCPACWREGRRRPTDSDRSHAALTALVGEVPMQPLRVRCVQRRVLVELAEGLTVAADIRHLVALILFESRNNLFFRVSLFGHVEPPRPLLRGTSTAYDTPVSFGLTFGVWVRPIRTV